MRILLILLSYILGSISMALIIGKRKGVNLFKRGTRNPGATNVFKLIGPGWGILTGLTDILKGIIPTFIAREILNYDLLWVSLIALAAIVGHNWPFLYSFKGGRGLATTMGTILILDFNLAVLAFISGVILTWLSRLISKRDLRIAYFVYPLFTLLVTYYRMNLYLLIYGCLITSIALFRAWQVRDRYLERG